MYKLNPWWEGNFQTNAIHRPKYMPQPGRRVELRDVILITGLRRVGKTTIMKQVIEKLLQQANARTILGVSLDTLTWKNTLYPKLSLNFEKSIFLDWIKNFLFFLTRSAPGLIFTGS